MQLDFTVTTEDYIAFNAYLMRTSGPLRQQATRQRVVATVLAFAIALLIDCVLIQDRVFGLVAAGVVAVALWFVLPILHRRHVERTLRKLAVDDGLGPTGPARATIDDTGLQEEIAGVSTSIPWRNVERVAETAEHVFVGPNAALIIAKRAGPDVLMFVAEVRARVGGARA